MAALLDLGRRQHGGERQAGAERLRQGQDVRRRRRRARRRTACRCGRARSAPRRRSAACRARGTSFERREVARRRLEHAAGAEDRLGDAPRPARRSTGGRSARSRSRVRRASRSVAAVPIEARPVAFGRRECTSEPGSRRAVALAAGGVGGRGRRPAGDAVPGAVNADDLEARRWRAWPCAAPPRWIRRRC